MCGDKVSVVEGICTFWKLRVAGNSFTLRAMKGVMGNREWYGI